MGTGDLEDGPAVDGRLIHFFSIDSKAAAPGVPAVGVCAAMHLYGELYFWPGVIEPPFAYRMEAVLGDIGGQPLQIQLGVGLELGDLFSNLSLGLPLRRRFPVGAMLGLDESFQFDG